MIKQGKVFIIHFVYIKQDTSGHPASQASTMKYKTLIILIFCFLSKCYHFLALLHLPDALSHVGDISHAKPLTIFILIWNELQHDKTNKMTCAPSEDSDQPGHFRCLHEEAMGPWLPIKHTEDSDQTEWMPRLIWVIAGCTCHFVCFVMCRLKLHQHCGKPMVLMP